MKKTLLLLFFVAVGLQAKAEMSLVVRPLYEADHITALRSIGKLVYLGDSLYLYDTEQTLIYQEELGKVKHVRYSDELPPISVGDVETQYIASQMVVYPNPTADMLYIDNAEAGEVRLYISDGRLLQVIGASEDRVEINMSAYPVGTYVLFCSGEAFSVIKK